MNVTHAGDDPVPPERGVPWTADPSLRWECGQAGAVLAAITILRGIADGDNLDPGYWRDQVCVALMMLGYAAVNQ